MIPTADQRLIGVKKMARTTEIKRTEMLDAAIGLIEERGKDALTARALADRLGVSTQPIYREFGDMDGLRAATAERGFSIVAECMRGDALDSAVNYVKFALEHRGLFDFLFRGRSCRYDGPDDLAHKLVGTDIIDRLAQITGPPVERTYRLHMLVWMTLHGLASMSADNVLPISDEELRALVKELTRALTEYYKEKDDTLR